MRNTIITKTRSIVVSKMALAFSILLAFSVVSTGAGAEKYPTKSIEVIIGYEAGGGGDVLLRIIAKHLSQELGKPIIVVNKPGGGGIPATLDAMKAEPDGYSLMCDTQAQSSFQIGRKDIPFDPLDRSFICKVAVSPYALFSDPRLAWKSLKDVATFIKEQPDKFTWGGIGGPSGTTFSQLQFFDLLGAEIKKMKMVVYKGSGPILVAVAGGHVMFGSAGASAVPPFHQGGKVKTLVVTGDKTLKMLPGAPSAKEAGYPELNVDMWIGLSGPPKIPQVVIDTINKAVKKTIQSPEFIADLDKVCSVPAFEDPETFRKFIIEEAKVAKKLRDIMGW